MANKTVRITVTGVVQGVGFRYFTMREAHQLGVTGYAENLPSGQVQIIATGENGMIAELIEAVKIGPRYGSVSDVFVEDLPLNNDFTSFGIR